MDSQDSDDGAISSAEGLELYDRSRLGPAFFAILFVASAVALAYTVAALVHDIILAFVLVALFRPMYQRACRALGGRRWAASAIVTLLIIVLVAAPITFLAFSLVDQAQEAAAALDRALGARSSDSDRVKWLTDHAHGLLDRVGIAVPTSQLHALVERAGTLIQQSAWEAGQGVVSGLLSLLIHMSVLLMIVFYLLVDADRLRDYIYRLSPLPEDEEELITRRFGEVARGTLVGNGIGSVAQGALCGLAMWVVGLPSPLFGAAIMSIFAFLPLAGVSIVVIPLSGYLFLQGQGGAALLFFGFCMSQAVVFENVVKTKLIGSSAAMPDLLAFLAIVGGLAVFGVLGLFYGPLIATAFLTLADLYRQRYHRALALNFVSRRL